MNISVQEAAGSGGSAGSIALVVGVIVVVGLIAAFVFGARRKEQEPPPAALSELSEPEAMQPEAEPRAGSWSAPASTPGRSPQGQDAPSRE